MSVEIKTYTIAELNDFINSKEFSELQHLPISRHRASSYINNPRGLPNDKVMYLAYISGELVGYRLVLPDVIKSNNVNEKIGWYSCIWTNPKKRGLGIAKKLVEVSMKDWDGKIMFQGPVVASKQLYTSTNPFNENIVKGIRAYARFDFTTVIKNKAPKLKAFLPIISIGDSFLNLFISSSSNHNNYSNTEIIHELNTEIIDFINSKNETNIFQRNQSDFNWILNHPWVLEQSEDNESKKFHFSSVAKEFKYIPLVFYTNNKTIDGFVVYQLRDSHLSIQTAYFNDSAIEDIINYTYQLIGSNKVNYFSCFDERLVEYIYNNQNPFIFKKELKRAFYYTKKLETIIKKNPQLQFEAGDGDMIFT